LAEAGPHPQGAPPQAAVLVLTRNVHEAALVEAQLELELDDWEVHVRCLTGDPEQAALAASNAIFDVEPALVLFVGSAPAAETDGAGDVVIAERVSKVEHGMGRRVRPRRRTRRADPDLLRHAHRVGHEGRWRARPGMDLERAGQVRFGLVATGSQAVAMWADGGAATCRDFFSEVVGLDPSGWDFVFGYYDDEDLPAMTILGLAADSDEDEEAARMCTQAAAVAAELIAAVPVAGLRAHPVDSTAEEGELQHLARDTEALSHESTERILQRPFADSRRAATARRGETSVAAKETVGVARVNAYLDPEGVAPPDLSLRIRLSGSTLQFELNADRPDLPYHDMEVGETKLSGEFGDTPPAYRENLKARVRAIAARPDKADVVDLQNLGSGVYNDLFPEELKRAYAEFRDMGVRSLLVTSDEPWIPWELARPHSPDFEEPDDFLCMRFAMTRWLPGDNTKHRFKIESMAPLEAGAIEGEELLASAREECEYLTELAERCQVENLSPGCARFDIVRSLLRLKDREVHLWHVAAHGRLGDTDPDESVIVFSDRPWRAGDLIAEDGYAIQQTRPLVFFNACLVGQQDFKATRLAGWPAVWVAQNRCGGFIAPQWSVNSDLAKVFSQAFYAALSGAEDMTLGEAARLARHAARDENPVDPTWLSYAVYGHPNARVQFGRAPAPEPVAS
jgi:CHAT domain